MLHKHLVKFILPALCVLAFGPGGSLLAQSTGTGVISGTVSDKTGALIPGAQVTITHLATGLARGATTNEKGFYTFVALPVGQHEVKAQMTGFKTFLQKGVILEADAKVTVDIVLEVGETSESVTITDSPPAIQSDSGEVSTLVSGVQVSELAMNGRNFSQFLTLGPGVTSSQTGRQMGVGQEGNPLMSIHGGRVNNTKFTYDGTLAMDTGGNRGLNLFPPMEAIQEVRIMKSNYSADSGSYGYGLVNLVTKSGGKDFHGSFYEYLRNDLFDARNFFASNVSPLKLNNFGYTIGGPFFIPGKYNQERNKTFFFWSQSWNLRRGPQLVSFTAPATGVFTGQTPSAAMRRGDFSELLPTRINDPLTRQPFLNNQIPLARIDPNAVLLLNTFYPLPNRAGTPNFTSTPSSATNWREELVRVDHHFSERISLMLRYAQDKWEQNQAIIRPAPQAFPTIGGFFSKPGNNFTGKLTTIFSQKTINEATIGFSRNRITTVPAESGRRPAGLTIQEVFPFNRNNVIPTIALAQGFGAIGVGNQLNNVNLLYTIKDDFSHLVSNHSLKFGAEIIRFQKFSLTSPDLQGNYSFNGGVTGHSVADFLLGEAFSYTELENLEKIYLFARNWEMYAQDDWKLKPNFTLNLGVRYHILAGAPQATEKFNRLSTFVPQLYDPAKAPRVIAASGQLVPGSGDPLNGIITPDNKRGLDLPRSLVKTHYDTIAPRLGFAWSPDQKTALRGGYGIFYFWGNNVHEGLTANPPYTRSVNIFNTKLSNPAAGQGSNFPPNVTSFDTEYLIPTIQHWSLNVQRQIARDTVLSVAYVGTRGVHLEQVVNINQPAPNLDVAQRRININAVRPFLGYGNLPYAERSASSNYHGLQAQLLRRINRGLMFQAAYTYSKAMEWGLGQDVTTQRNEKALTDLDRTHVFVFNFVYQLPFFQKQQGVAGKLLGGWQLSGVTTLQSGLPFTVTAPGDRAGTGSGGQRPDLVGKLVRTKELTRWFDTSVFAQAPLGRFGTAGRNIIRGPGINDWSTSLFKNTRLSWFNKEGARLQFGVEVFNLFNHAQFEAVGGAFGGPTFGRVLSARSAHLAVPVEAELLTLTVCSYEKQNYRRNSLSRIAVARAESGAEQTRIRPAGAVQSQTDGDVRRCAPRR